MKQSSTWSGKLTVTRGVHSTHRVLKQYSKISNDYKIFTAGQKKLIEFKLFYFLFFSCQKSKIILSKELQQKVKLI